MEGQHCNDFSFDTSVLALAVNVFVGRQDVCKKTAQRMLVQAIEQTMRQSHTLKIVADVICTSLIDVV